ncbi:DinB family protein [Leptolinea tardivitalis]|uniref:DinB-like domain-containing protein n=1 Tax=Leptolinea tardivitalis TaxID=229920 RepID=A0A0P6Y0P7_9CHLR|nr:DinB family protein [Leptolinea tardivitalis]KPL75065.1 hypothetical protein ADM99_00060 [Leptolinea tardivitalis]
MRIEIGLENGYEGKSIAWALDYPGCFAYGSEGAAAILAFPRAFIGYKERVNALAEKSWIDFDDIDIHLAETFECYPVDEKILPSAAGRNVTAFWQVDWKPLSKTEIDQGLQVMSWSRRDLVELTQNLPSDLMDREFPGEKWSIRGILDHLASSELWLLDRLNPGVSESKTLPEETFRRLEATRNIFERSIRNLAGSSQVNGKDGSFWSPRKILRRAAWHEVDHINHILRLINEN